jgi:hypothetical protein
MLGAAFKRLAPVLLPETVSNMRVLATIKKQPSY